MSADRFSWAPNLYRLHFLVEKHMCQPDQANWYRYKKKNSSNESFPIHVPLPGVYKPFDKSWAHSFSAQSRRWNLFWKNHANSSALLASLPANEAMHVTWPRNVFFVDCRPFFCLTLEISPASKFSPGGVFYNFAQDCISSVNGQSRLNWCSG